MPDVVLDELLNLMLPLWFKHNFFNRLNCDHESVHILNEDVISSDEQFLATTTCDCAIGRG